MFKKQSFKLNLKTIYALFYFMEPMEEGYTPNEKMFVESSSYGVLESKIIFKEKR